MRAWMQIIQQEKKKMGHSFLGGCDGYFMAYKPIKLLCILFVFIEMKFICCHSCVIFPIKSMSICND